MEVTIKSLKEFEAILKKHKKARLYIAAQTDIGIGCYFITDKLVFFAQCKIHGIEFIEAETRTTGALDGNPSFYIQRVLKEQQLDDLPH